MLSKRLVWAASLAIAFASGASAQVNTKGKAAVAGGLAGAGQAIADQAQRQIDLEREIEAARAKAAIELDFQRKLAAQRASAAQAQQASAVAPPAQNPELATLDRSYPAWFEHAESANFKQWMASQPKSLQDRFARVQTAAELLAMLNEHRLSLGMEPVRLVR